jgi:hypothetical protein
VIITLQRDNNVAVTKRVRSDKLVGHFEHGIVKHPPSWDCVTKHPSAYHPQKNLVSKLLDRMKPNPTQPQDMVPEKKKKEEQLEEVRFSATQLLETCYGSRGLFPSSGAFA